MKTETPSETILLVDDFAPWRQWVRTRLARHNHFRIFEAANGGEAIQKATELEPDLILLDIGLPDFNGIEVAEQVRRGGIQSEIVFLTMQRDAAIQSRAMATGAKGYLLKTNADVDLIPALEAVLHADLSPP